MESNAWHGRDPDGVPDRRYAAVRDAGLAAYHDHDWNADILDLVFDSAVDGPVAGSRQLRFDGPGCTVEVNVQGVRRLTVELRVSPPGPVVMEARSPGSRTARTVLWTDGRAMVWLRPQLTSFLLRWPGSDRPPARTAWVAL
jgi:hypothetical protein